MKLFQIEQINNAIFETLAFKKLYTEEKELMQE